MMQQQQVKNCLQVTNAMPYTFAVESLQAARCTLELWAGQWNRVNALKLARLRAKLFHVSLCTAQQL